MLCDLFALISILLLALVRTTPRRELTGWRSVLLVVVEFEGLWTGGKENGVKVLCCARKEVWEKDGAGVV